MGHFVWNFKGLRQNPTQNTLPIDWKIAISFIYKIHELLSKSSYVSLKRPPPPPQKKKCVLWFFFLQVLISIQPSSDVFTMCHVSLIGGRDIAHVISKNTLNTSYAMHWYGKSVDAFIVIGYNCDGHHGHINQDYPSLLGPLLLTWFNFSPRMDK